MTLFTVYVCMFEGVDICMICISPHTSPTKPLLHCIDDDAEGADCEGRQDFKQNSLCVVFPGQDTLVSQTRVEVETYLNRMII